MLLCVACKPLADTVSRREQDRIAADMGCPLEGRHAPLVRDAVLCQAIKAASVLRVHDQKLRGDAAAGATPGSSPVEATPGHSPVEGPADWPAQGRWEADLGSAGDACTGTRPDTPSGSTQQDVRRDARATAPSAVQRDAPGDACGPARADAPAAAGGTRPRPQPLHGRKRKVQLPPEREAALRAQVCAYLGTEAVTPADLEALVRTPAERRNEAHVSHWQTVAGRLNADPRALGAFVRRWRRAFIEGLEPAHMPVGWAVEYDLEKFEAP